MMKKLLYILLILFLSQIHMTASECNYEYVCPDILQTQNTVSTIVAKMTGIDFLQIRTTEFAIEKYIKQKTNNDISISITAKSAKALKNGEFEAINVTADKLNIQNCVLTDFHAITLCNYNKIIFNNNEYKFPYDVPAEFTAYITNEDLNDIVNLMFQTFGYNFNKLFNVNCVLYDSKIIINVSSKLYPKTYSITSNLELINGKIKLTDYQTNINSTFLKTILYYTDILPKLSFKFKIAQNIYGYIRLGDLCIINDKIYLKGLFIIPKNCDIKE